MKNIILLLAILGWGFSPLIAQTNWKLNISEAVEEAKKTNRPVLLSFAGSDWCRPCIKLTKEVFETSEFEEYAEENLVLVLLDFPRLKKNRLPEEQVSHNEKLAEKYNKDGVFPLVVLIDYDGNVINTTGYRPGGPLPFIDYLKTATQ